MEFKDKVAFKIKMEKTAIKFDRKINDEQCEVYFDDLKDYPIKVVEKAMDQALRDRDPEDMFLIRAMLTIPEIRAAADDLINKNKVTGRLGCEKCGITKGWITETTKDGRYVAHPCDCLAEMVRDELKRKARTRADRDNDRHLEDILIAYEISKLR